MQAPLSIVVAEVLEHTPGYVWMILAALVVLGSLQMRTQEMSRARVLLLPIGLGAYSLWGAAAMFGLQWSAVVAWALAMTLMLWLARWVRWPRDVRFVPERERFVVAGSAAPLAAMLTVFAVRYVGTVALVLNPQWRSFASVAFAGGLVYGVLSGLFAMRARTILGGVQSVAPASGVRRGVAPAAQ